MKNVPTFEYCLGVLIVRDMRYSTDCHRRFVVQLQAMGLLAGHKTYVRTVTSSKTKPS